MSVSSTIKLTGDDAFQITWNWVAGGQTIEDFTATDVPKTHMNGTSNRWGATCRGSDQLEHAALRRDSLRDTGKLVAARILRGRLRDDTKYAALLAK